MSDTATIDPMTQEQSPLTLTPQAADEIREYIKDQELEPEKTYLRVGVKGGGCSGFQYSLDLIEADGPDDGDTQLESQGVRILCDDRSLLYLEGVEVGFHGEGLHTGFVFKNPNASSTCGCGSSFTV
jgi:iron-sulfur cluster assembly protein